MRTDQAKLTPSKLSSLLSATGHTTPPTALPDKEIDVASALLFRLLA